MSLERHTISSWRLALALTGLSLATITAAVAGRAWPDADTTPPPQVEPSDPLTAFLEPPWAASLGAPPADAAADRGADEGSAEPTEEEVRSAHKVAADFVVAYVSYRWDEPPDAALERVRPLATPELAATLDRASGGQAGREELAARQQTVAAAIEAVQQQEVGPGWVDLVVVTRQEVTTTEGADTRHESFLTRVVRTDDGWRVAGFQP